MGIREICRLLAEQLISVFSATPAGLPEREDSRAFGAMIEERIMETWTQVCENAGFLPLPRPGRRTIYDLALADGSQVVGVDIKTKDLDVGIYSDGGICSVANLLSFLSTKQGIFLIAEFGHKATTRRRRRIEYIRVAPLAMLPQDVYRIENLGTGQIRLDPTIHEVWDEIDWDRSLNEFYENFVEKAIAHYQRVTAKADQRIAYLKEFQRNGYTRFNSRMIS